MEPNGTTDLRESVFFTSRKARLPLNTQGPASSSSQYYSNRIRTMMECKSKFDMSEEDAEIEASKDHWTEVKPEYFTAAAALTANVDSSTSSEWTSGSCKEELEQERMRLYEENVEVIRSLQKEHPESRFFQIGNGGLEFGRKIAEGGQAEIYDGGSKYATEKWNDIGEEIPIALKVFKAGYRLLDLQKLWPVALLHKLTPVNDEEYVWVNDGTVYNPMLYGRLLGDGRFAFEMIRFWGDLRKLLDLRMQHNGNQHPPFMMPDGNYHECCMLHLMKKIARAIRHFHQEGTLHRDLKAANVLIESDRFIIKMKEEDRLDPIQMEHNFFCVVTDFDSSNGVMGTRYWRAPEILGAKNGPVHITPNLFTQKSDVYSYAMTCYEIITGCLPFEDLEDKRTTSIDDVLRGRRPTLPSHLRPWIKELLYKCWHMDPSERPTFNEIVDILEDIASNDPGCQSESDFFRFHQPGVSDLA